jgi:hypothetical protein
MQKSGGLAPINCQLRAAETRFDVCAPLERLSPTSPAKRGRRALRFLAAAGRYAEPAASLYRIGLR